MAEWLNFYASPYQGYSITLVQQAIVALIVPLLAAMAGRGVLARAGLGWIAGTVATGIATLWPATAGAIAYFGLRPTYALLAGIAVYARFMTGVEQWIRANAINDVTLPSLTGIAAGWWVALFVVMLALAAWGMGLAEQAFARLRPVR